jgi:hypothetical protein
LLLVAIAAGCARGGEEQLLQQSQLPQLVLKPADLDKEWTQFDEGRQLRADALPGARSDPNRFERQGGWKARFRRPGSPATVGPLVVESRADLFAAVSGAEEDFDAAVDALEQGAAPSRPVETLDLGDEARLFATGGGEPGALTTVTIAWREQNVVAVMTANGFSGKLVPAQVVALARKQQQRLENASN